MNNYQPRHKNKFMTMPLTLAAVSIMSFGLVACSKSKGKSAPACVPNATMTTTNEYEYKSAGPDADGKLSLLPADVVSERHPDRVTLKNGKVIELHRDHDDKDSKERADIDFKTGTVVFTDADGSKELPLAENASMSKAAKRTVYEVNPEKLMAIAKAEVVRIQNEQDVDFKYCSVTSTSASFSYDEKSQLVFAHQSMTAEVFLSPRTIEEMNGQPQDNGSEQDMGDDAGIEIDMDETGLDEMDPDQGELFY